MANPNAMNNHAAAETEATLSALDGLSRAPAPDFFLSRLEARMAREQVSGRSGALGFLLRPAVAVSLLLFFVAVNVLLLLAPAPSAPAGKRHAGLQQATAGKAGHGRLLGKDWTRRLG